MRFFHHQASARQRSWWLTVAFALAVLWIVVAVNLALAAAMLLWPLNWWGGFELPRHFWWTNTAIVLLFVLGGWALERSNMGRDGAALAKRAGAVDASLVGKSVNTSQARHLIQEMALSANMPAPKLMVLPRLKAINAFAAGWGLRDAVIAVSEGALDELTREELSGLVAHEMSHIREGDTQLNMRLVGLCSGLEMLWRFGCDLSERDAQSGAFTATALVGLPLKWVGWTGHAAALCLRSLVLQEREYLADARAVQWTRNPEALGRVLRKLLWQQDHDEADFSPSHPLVAHMQLQVHGPQDDAMAQWFERRFATHPPIEERIARIYGEPMDALACKARYSAVF